MDAKVWVAQLDIQTQGLTGCWLTVHESREGARRAICEHARAYKVTDLYQEAARQDLATSDDAGSSAFAKNGPREITWVINRHTIEPD